jgi:hypothetical protein
MKARTGMKGMKKGKDGSAIVLTMCITTLITMSAASLMLFADYQVGAVERARQDNVAMAIAEAGANAAYATLKTNFANKDNASLFPVTTYNNGYFDATVTSVGSNKAQISCVGVSGISTQTVVVDIQDFTIPVAAVDATSPYGHSIFVNGSGTMNGSGNVYGSVRCNQDLRANGSFLWGTPSNACNVYCSVEFRANGSATLHGMCYAPNVNAPAGVPRTVQAVPQVPFPTLDLSSYYNTAVANGQVYAGGTYSGGSIGVIPGGVRWYNGALTMNGGVNYSGCIIATGEINFKGGCTQTKVGNLPAVISRDGGVTLSGSRTMQGLVYSKGNFTCNGSGRLDGTVLVGGTMTLNGSYGIIAYEYCDPGNGGSAGSSTPDVGVTAWQK